MVWSEGRARSDSFRFATIENSRMTTGECALTERYRLKTWKTYKSEDAFTTTRQRKQRRIIKPADSYLDGAKRWKVLEHHRTTVAEGIVSELNGMEILTTTDFTQSVISSRFCDAIVITIDSETFLSCFDTLQRRQIAQRKEARFLEASVSNGNGLQKRKIAQSEGCEVI